MVSATQLPTATWCRKGNPPPPRQTWVLLGGEGGSLPQQRSPVQGCVKERLEGDNKSWNPRAVGIPWPGGVRGSGSQAPGCGEGHCEGAPPIGGLLALEVCSGVREEGGPFPRVHLLPTVQLGEEMWDDRQLLSVGTKHGRAGVSSPLTCSLSAGENPGRGFCLPPDREHLGIGTWAAG